MITQQQIAEYINTAIAQISYPTAPQGLYQPIAYAMSTGGKRLRPTLLLSTTEAFGGDMHNAVNQAVGIEMFHNFTLVHDDVMDNADIRRGRPTVARKYGRDTAILSGDTMLTMATQLVCKCTPQHLADVITLFNRTATEVYEGQQYDMDFESRNDVTVEEYMSMIRLKTSVLLACACQMGAIMANAEVSDQLSIYSYGIALGLAFQLRDDYLDTFGDPLIFGKQIGGDILNCKKTWLLINAMAEDESGELRHILDADDLSDDDKITRVRNIYTSLNLHNRICNEIEKLSNDAINALSNINLKPGWKEHFSSIASDLVNRVI